MRLWLGALLVGWAWSGVTSADEEVERVVAYEGVELVEVNMRAMALELDLEGVAGDQISGVYEYAKAEYKPMISYSVEGGRGALHITEPGVEDWDGSVDIEGDGDWGWKLQDRETDWELELGDGAEIALGIKVGAVEGDIDLRGLRLSGFDLEVGAGDVDLDLRGQWQGNVEGEIEVGVGDLDIILPSNIGLAVVMESGIGDVDIAGLERVEGEEVESEGFRIPGLGLEIKSEKGGWFDKHFGQSGVWTNEAYGNASSNLRLKIKMGIGELDILTGN